MLKSLETFSAKNKHSQILCDISTNTLLAQFNHISKEE